MAKFIKIPNLRKLGETVDKLDRAVGEYSDTLALILVSVGGLLAAVAVGDLPHGGTTGGYNFVYLKSPFMLRVGLTAVVFGFVSQLWHNLVEVHKLNERKAFWLLAIIFVSLLMMALWG